MSRKDKLKAGLEGLFSTPKPQATEETDATEPAPIAAPEATPDPAETDTPAAALEETESEIMDREPEATLPIEPAHELSDEVASWPDQREDIEGDITDEALPVAEEASAAPTDVAQVQLVVFMLAEEYYGVSIGVVQQIIKMQPITAVPRTPDYVAGLTNLRGAVLPVLDLRKRFGLPARELTKDSRIMVVSLNGTTVGLVVDAVLRVQRVPESRIEPPSPLVTAVDSAYIAGVAKIAAPGQILKTEVAPERLVVLLDLDRVLAVAKAY